MFGNIRGKVKTWLTAGAGTIAAVLIAGLLGAFGALPEPPVQEFPKGIAIDAGQWKSCRYVPMSAMSASTTCL
jgi:hypothetical protein